MNTLIIIISIVAILVIVGFIPLWPKAVKTGYVKINTWDKIQIMLGIKHTD